MTTKVLRGAMTGRFYYVAGGMRNHPSGLKVASGKKVDITEDLLPYLKKAYHPRVNQGAVRLHRKTTLGSTRRGK